MFLDFEKWHGCANDFVVCWITDRDGDMVLDSLKRQAKALCDRHTGIGADGLLVLQTTTPDELMPHKMTIVNSDGSLAQNCGNGLRCAITSVRRRFEKETKHLPEAVELTVEGHLKSGRFFPKRVGEYPYVAVEMGVPTLNEDVPFFDEAKEVVRNLAKKSGIRVEDVFVATVQNPHIVIKVEDATREAMLAFGPALQEAASWDGMNVHVVSEAEVTDADQTFAGNALGGRVSEAYRAYVWERGAGETMACGSGACAIAAAILEEGLTERSEWMAVDMPGGRLYVKQEDPNEPTVLAGPATHVFDGRIEF